MFVVDVLLDGHVFADSMRRKEMIRLICLLLCSDVTSGARDKESMHV